MKNIVILTFTIILIQCIMSFNYINLDSNKPLDLNNSKIQLEGKDLENIREVEQEEIITACLLLSRNYIVGNRDKLDKMIEATQFNKGKVFDKLVLSMLKNCFRNLKIEQAQKVLSVEHITDIYSHELSLFDSIHNVGQSEPYFDDEELGLLKLIYGGKENKIEAVNESMRNDKYNAQEDLLSVVMSELETTQTQYIIYGILSSFLSCLLGWYVIGGILQNKRRNVPSSGNASKKKN